MPESKKTKILRDGLREHPAVQAWSLLGPRRVQPERIEVIKRREKGLVCRLVYAGVGQSDVVAKRCEQAKATVERLVYERVFPHLPLATLRFYGFAEEADGECCWLFLEDIGDQPYLPSVDEHRVQAARWLGVMHACAEDLDLEPHLPGRGPDNYLIFLRSIPEALHRVRDASALDAKGWAVLEDILSMCETLELHWSQIESFCDELPRTLVHGDCLAKNILVRTDPVGAGIVFLDWGSAGWGLPATDLGLLGLPHNGQLSNERGNLTYLRAVQDQWPNLDVRTVRRLERLGQMFWALKVISLGVDEFDYPWARTEDTLRNFQIYGSVLADAMRSGAWSP